MRCQAAALSLLLLLCITVVSGRDVTVGIISLMTFDGWWAGPRWARMAGCSLLALNHMNSRDTIMVPQIANLPAGFNASYILDDSGGVPSTAVGAAVDMVLRGVDGFVGPLTAAAVGPAALIAGTYKKPLVGYGSPASELSDKATYPYFARTSPSDSNLVLSVIQACSQVGWTHVTVVYQDDKFGKSIAEDINTISAQIGVQVLTAQKFNYLDAASYSKAVEATKSYGGRIFLFAAYSPFVDDLLFAADDAGLIGPGYVWMKISGGGDAAGMMRSSSDPERAARVLAGVLELRPTALSGEKMQLFTNALAIHDAEKLYDPKMGPKEAMLPALTSPPDDTCSYAYDATIALGLALAHAQESGDGLLDREDVLKRLRNSDFQGATGHVKTNNATGDRLPEGVTMLVYSFYQTMQGNVTVVDERTSAVMDAGVMVMSGAPYWGPGLESWDFIPGDGFQCEEGHALSEQTLLCVPCPAGTEQRGSACSPCERGRHSPEPASVACPKCTDGYANETGQVQCHPCPFNTQRPAGTAGVAIAECVCVPGTYTTSLQPGVECAPCPAGAVCEGGMTPPYPQPGFWGERRCVAHGGEMACERWDEFLECRYADCLGGPDFECAPGRAGRLCRETAEEWYNVGRIVFFECSGSGTAVAFLGILGVVAAWSLIAVATLFYASIDVMVQFMLVNAMVALFGLKWHSNLNKLNVFLKIANFDVDFVSPGCFGEWQPENAFFLQLLLPPLVTMLYTLFLVAYRAAYGNQGGHSIRSNALRVFLSLSITVYHTALYKSFATFRCEVYPDGKQYHALYPEIECWQPSHVSMMTFGIIYIIFGGLGLPAWIWWRIHVHREEGTLHDDEVNFSYAWLHERYVMKWKNWWAVVCFRRFAVAFIAALVPWSMVQGMVTVMLIMALLTMQVMVSPHASHRIDLLEFFSKVMTNLYVLGGMLGFGSITAKAQGRVCAEDATGVDALFCGEENDIKNAISLFSLVSMAVTLALAGVLAFTFAWDEMSSERAAKRLRLWFSSSQAQSCCHKGESAEVEVPARSEIGHILSSSPVLRWVRQLQAEASKEGDPEQGRAECLSPTEFAELEHGLADLVLHFNSSNSLRADILNKVCNTPGLLEWIAVEREGRESVLRFVNGFADFLRREKVVTQLTRASSLRSKNQELLGEADGVPMRTGSYKRTSLENAFIDMAAPVVPGLNKPTFPVSDLVKSEHSATAAYYLMTCSDDHRESFCKMIDLIIKTSSPSAETTRDFRRSSSLHPDDPAAISAMRVASADGLGPRRLSLDDYTAPQARAPSAGWDGPSSPMPLKAQRRSLQEAPAQQDAPTTGSPLPAEAEPPARTDNTVYAWSASGVAEIVPQAAQEVAASTTADDGLYSLVPGVPDDTSIRDPI